MAMNHFRFYRFLLIVFFIIPFKNIPTITNAFDTNYTPIQAKPNWQFLIPYQGNINPEAIRQAFLLNEGWDYLEDNFPSIDKLNDPELKWQKINLPHTWNAFDVTDNDPGYRRDANWYRKAIMIPDFDEPLIFRLYFEGVNISCDVYVNGKKAGSHVGGYVGFTIDISPFIKKGTMNLIDVRADNSINPDIIPSQKSDFFIFGGITRDLWLQILSPTFIDQIQISTPKVNEKTAETSASLTLIHHEEKEQKFTVEIAIKNPEGKIVSKKSMQTNLKPGMNTVSLNLPMVKKPALWSPEHPNLYEMTVQLQSDKIVDELSERFGYR